MASCNDIHFTLLPSSFWALSDRELATKRNTKTNEDRYRNFIVELNDLKRIKIVKKYL
jgi:hypothetical protein